MSADSKKARAERRAAEVVELGPDIDAPPEVEDEAVHAVALIADTGGYRLAVLALPTDVVETYATRVSESEVLGVQLALAQEALEVGVCGNTDADGRPARPSCSRCGAAALVRHPNKPVMMCAACDARHEVAHG